MSDKIEITGIEITINGKKFTLHIEDAWELKRELDKLLHTESVPYPWPVEPIPPYVPYVPYYETTWGNNNSGEYYFNSEVMAC